MKYVYSEPSSIPRMTKSERERTRRDPFYFVILLIILIAPVGQDDRIVNCRGKLCSQYILSHLGAAPEALSYLPYTYIYMRAHQSEDRGPRYFREWEFQ